MKKRAVFFVLAIFLMSGCASEERTDSTNEVSNTVSSVTSLQTPYSAVSSTETATMIGAYIEPDEVIPAAIQSPRTEGDRLSYTIMNVFSEDKYYTIEISGVRMDSTAEVDMETTYVNGELYGDFRLDLISGGELLDTYKINVPRDDRFLIMESVMDDLSYGCELISNKREFKTRDYPDLIQLDFHIINEMETPQYARFFAVFDGKLAEVPVYENGVEKAPYGTHLEMIEAGLMDQYIVASVNDSDYTILKYEYTFDMQQKCLIRQRILYW